MEKYRFGEVKRKEIISNDDTAALNDLIGYKWQIKVEKSEMKYTHIDL